MKKVGQIIELDPTKKYIVIFDAMQFPKEDARQIYQMIMKEGGAGILCNPEGISFVENSDRIVDMIVDNPADPSKK